MAANVEPVKAIINGKKCVRVCDLAEAWGTTTSTILATDKPHAVPEKYIHRLNGLVWCELEGLRQRAEATKNRKSSYISRNILALLDELETPETPTPEPTDLGTADLIADARRTASQALNTSHINAKIIAEYTADLYSLKKHVEKLEDNNKRVEKLEKQMDAAESIVKSAANVAEEASEAVDGVETNVMEEMERVTRLYADVDKAKKKVRALDWTVAAMAALGVVASGVTILACRR